MFSDKDKFLLIQALNYKEQYSQNGYCIRIRALLARLEAAEANVQAAFDIEDMVTIPERLGPTSQSVAEEAIKKYHETRKAWIRSKGE